MAKTLRTTSALAVVVMVLVGACSSSTATPSPAASAPAATPAATPAASASAAASAAGIRGPVGIRAGRAQLAGGPDRLQGAGPGTRCRQALQRQEGLDPDPVDRRRGERLRERHRRLPDGDRHRGPGRQHRLEPRDRAQDPRSRAAARRTCRRSRSRPAVLAYAKEGKVQDIAAIVGPDGAAKLKADFPSTIGLTVRRRPHLEHPDQGRRQVDDLVPGQGLRGQGLHGSRRRGTSSSPCPTRSSPTAATRSASAPAAPARRRAGS